MSRNRINLDDQTLLALYATFQNARRSLGEIYLPARYDDFVDRGRYEGSAFLVTMVAQEQILEATNTINRFGYDLRSITAWGEVFESATEEERMLALFEFVFPITSASLSAPYSIKQMFVRSICQISYQTNCLHDNNGNVSLDVPIYDH
jgi:hypothetical protein